MAYGGFDLSGKVAFVTGASRGIGRAIALGLADSGADLFLCSRTLADLQAIAREVRARGRKAEVAAVDVRSVESIQAGVGAAFRTFGQIDILVNNAGINNPFAALEVTEDNFNVHVNAIGPTLIRTDLTRFVLDDPVAYERMLAKIPLGRAGEVQDVVGAAIYLASPASNLVTGHLLMVDGGWTAQ